MISHMIPYIASGKKASKTLSRPKYEQESVFFDTVYFTNSP